MDRRSFLKGALYAAGSTGVLGGAISPRQVWAACSTPAQRRVINIALLGGADLRQLFVPEVPAQEALFTPYSQAFWKSRAPLYGTPSIPMGTTFADFQQIWANEYLAVGAGGFGINSKAGWLKTQFDLGHVAIVSNVNNSKYRDHLFSQLVIAAGDFNTGKYDISRDGWGGRLAAAMGPSANVVSVTNNMTIFCNGVDPTNRVEHVISLPRSRDQIFTSPHPTGVDEPSVMRRALKNYYAQKGLEVDTKIARGSLTQNWPYKKFINAERSLRAYGDALGACLTPSPRPAALAALYDSKILINGASNTLFNLDFGHQCASIFDAFLASDVVNFRIGSMALSGWDTHEAQKGRFNNLLSDLFGTGKGLDTLTSAIGTSMPGALDDLVWVFTTDFGRQLRPNGDLGTDHGDANYMIIVGNGVRGGVYGQMFPDSEIPFFPIPSTNPPPTPGIQAKTAFENVLAEVCNWAQPNSADLVFSGRSPQIEAGVILKNIFI